MADNRKIWRKQVDERQNDIIEILEMLIWPMVVLVLMFTFIFRPATVSGDSMLPSLVNDDRLIVSGFFYTPRQGDIVVLAADHYKDQPLVKRVIATEGQEVDINFVTGDIFVDGVKLEESYINEITQETGDVSFPQIVPKGCLFVMGDNRNHSMDSRFEKVGMVDNRYIVGRCLLRISPIEHFGFVG